MSKLLRVFTGCVLLLVMSAARVPAQGEKPPELTPVEKELPDKANKMDSESLQLYSQGRRKEAAAKAADALALIQSHRVPRRLHGGARARTTCPQPRAALMVAHPVRQCATWRKVWRTLKSLADHAFRGRARLCTKTPVSRREIRTYVDFSTIE